MAYKYVTFVVIVLVAALGRKIQVKLESANLPPGYTFNDENCVLVGMNKDLKGGEDLALGKHSILFVTVGDLFSIFESGAASSTIGGIWIMDVRHGASKEPVKIDIEGFPANKIIHGHGIDVSNTTDRLFFINHHGDSSSVEVLTIKYNMNCISQIPWRCSPVTLKFVTSISSTLFPNMGINDVVEADDNHVFVSRWRVFSFPTQGTKNPSGILESIKTFLDIPIHIFSLKLTTVYVCTISTSVCDVATDETFVGANGITINAGRDKLFVNDPTENLITVFNINPKNLKLMKESTINLPFAADNIEYDDLSDEIIIGTIPDLAAAIKKGMDPSFPVPGGMAIASLQGSGWKIRDILEHDGTKLSQISAAARFGPTVILGSPGSEGLLVCPNVNY